MQQLFFFFRIPPIFPPPPHLPRRIEFLPFSTSRPCLPSVWRDASDRAARMYFVRLRTGEGKLIEKIVMLE